MDVNAVLRARYFEVPNQSFIIGKKRALPGDQLFHEHRRLGVPGDEAPNLVEMPAIIEHIRENHGVPDRTRRAHEMLGEGGVLGKIVLLPNG